MSTSPDQGAAYLGAGPAGDDLRPETAARLRWVLETTGLLEESAAPEALAPPRVKSLGGGKDSQTYLVRCPSRDVVVKLNDEGLEAEARALRAWKPHTSSVPDVLGVGTVPATTDRPVEYLVITALLRDGDVVETAKDLLERSPTRARDVGRALGTELHRMHQARCSTGFGNFADTPGAERTYDTWSTYLEDFLLQHAAYVRDIGVDERRLEAARSFIHGCRYVDEGRCLHGDVTIRNVGILEHDPISISLFDPNPLSGDPSWDIAPMANNVAYGDRVGAGAAPSATLLRDRELLTGFWETYPRVVSDDALLTAQLVQAVLQAEHREEASYCGEHDDRDVEVTHDFIRDVFERMAT